MKDCTIKECEHFNEDDDGCCACYLFIKDCKLRKAFNRLQKENRFLKLLLRREKK